jgi:hypothetical protein
MAIVEKINIANFLGVMKEFYAEWKKVEAEAKKVKDLNDSKWNDSKSGMNVKHER